MTYRNSEERFWSHVEKADGCWEFGDGGGYGQILVDGKRLSAHRFSYSLAFGEIPTGMVICHKCDNPRCVRPEHLFAGTQGDNVRDCHAKKRHPLSIEITHCVRGHEFTPSNTYMRPDGNRQCIQCQRARTNAMRARTRVTA